jgi:hypothetical protein
MIDIPSLALLLLVHRFVQGIHAREQLSRARQAPTEH